MKLSTLLPETESRFKQIPRETVIRHVAAVKASGNYKSLETRIAWDLLHATFKANEICDWYEQFNCNDTHITTLAKETMHRVFPDII